MEIERRILGSEKVRLIDGSEKDINVYAVKLSEKNLLSRKHRKKVVIGTGKDKTIDVEIHDDKIIEGILDIAFNNQIKFDDLDFDADWIYNKYFNPENYTGEHDKKILSDLIKRKGEELVDLKLKLNNSKNSNTSEPSEVMENQ